MVERFRGGLVFKAPGSLALGFWIEGLGSMATRRSRKSSPQAARAPCGCHRPPFSARSRIPFPFVLFCGEELQHPTAEKLDALAKVETPSCQSSVWVSSSTVLCKVHINPLAGLSSQTCFAQLRFRDGFEGCFTCAFLLSGFERL